MKWIKWLFFLLFVAALAVAVAEWKRTNRLEAQLDILQQEKAALEDQLASANDNRQVRENAEMQRLRKEAEEVLALRNEVSQLRSSSRELEQLRNQHRLLQDQYQQLVSRGAGRPRSATDEPPAEPAAGAPIPREAWNFSGYGTPEAALVSAIWSMKEGNPQVYLDSLSPEEQVRMASTWQDKSEAEIAAKHQQDVAQIRSLRVLETQNVSPDEVVMKVFLDGVNRTENVKVKRVGNDWKVGGFIQQTQPAPAPVPPNQ